MRRRTVLQPFAPRPVEGSPGQPRNSDPSHLDRDQASSTSEAEIRANIRGHFKQLVRRLAQQSNKPTQTGRNA